MTDFSATLRCLLSESRKLKSLVIDQSEAGRDADWFELIKVTCEQIELLLSQFLNCVTLYNTALKSNDPLIQRLDSSTVSACTRSYLTSIKRSTKANLVLFSDQERVQKDLDALSAALKALIQMVAANQALAPDESSSEDDSDEDDDEDDDSENDDDDDNNGVSAAAADTSLTMDEIAARRPLPVIPTRKRASTRASANKTASTSVGARPRVDSSGILALDSALAMLDEVYNETDVLLQKSSATSTSTPVGDEKKEVILAVRLQDSSFQTLLRFNVSSTVDEALSQVRQSLIRVGQVDEADSTVYALFRVESPSERRLEPASAPLSKFGVVNRDVLIYKARDAVAQDDMSILLIGADAGRVLAMTEVDQRIHGLPRRINTPKRRLRCQASFVRAVDKRRYSLLLLFNDLLVVVKPKSGVSKLVDRMRTAMDTRRDDNVAGSPSSPVLSPVVTTRHGSSYHAASASASGDDGFEYVMSFELQFLHIREQSPVTEGLPHSFAVFGTSRFDNPPSMAQHTSSPRPVDDDSQLDQLPYLALQFTTSAERIDFLAELRKVIRNNRAVLEADGDFGEATDYVSPRKSVFTSLKRAPAPKSALSSTSTTPGTSSRTSAMPAPSSDAEPKSPPKSPAVSPRASETSPPSSPRDASVEVGSGGGSLRKRAVAQSPRPVFATKPPANEGDVRAHVKQVLVNVKAVRTGASSADERQLLRVQLTEFDDMCSRLDSSIVAPYRALLEAVREFARTADEGSGETMMAPKFHDIVEKARALMNTPMKQ